MLREIEPGRMTHTQVSGSEKTLLQAIRDEEIERPERINPA